ncbi:MAG TPA: serine hydrolase [Pyrinomonadaceae bacterium]|nr:serine hydrolase [Pyrinomonadaceae bacterium]
MTRKNFALTVALLFLSFLLPSFAQRRSNSQPPAIEVAAQTSALQGLVNRAAQRAVERFASKNFTESNLSITLIDLRDVGHPVQASFRGEERIYPASVVKLFYLAAAHRWMEDGRIRETDELKRGLHDMIVDSSNDATQFILDVLTDTTSGPELAPDQMRKWAYKRNAVNRYYDSMGYRNINVNQKTFCEDSYGREHAFRGAHGENRNKLTTNATARLLMEIATGRAVSPARSAQMMELLKRDFSGTSNDPDDQGHGFTGIALAPGARLWSKAGWTSTTRHDAAYIELPNGAKFVLVIFTTDHANERDIIPTIARVILEEFNH